MANTSNVGQPHVQASLVGEAIDHGPVAVLVVDEERRYVAVNDYACALLGYTRDELLESTVEELSAEPGTSERFERLLTDGTLAGRGHVRRKDGGTVEFEYRAQRTIVAGLSLFVSVGWPVEQPVSARPAPRRRSARARG